MLGAIGGITELTEQNVPIDAVGAFAVYVTTFPATAVIVFAGPGIVLVDGLVSRTLVRAAASTLGNSCGVGGTA